MMYLLDSDWLIHAMRGHELIVRHIGRHYADGIAVSIVCVGEVYDGAITDQESTTLQRLNAQRRYLARFEVLTLDDSIVERFARLRSRLRSQGRIIPDLDLLIAATALEHNLILMTGNVRHFERIPGLVLYQE